jgi:hypothetical protein
MEMAVARHIHGHDSGSERPLDITVVVEAFQVLSSAFEDGTDFRVCDELGIGFER